MTSEPLLAVPIGGWTIELTRIPWFAPSEVIADLLPRWAGSGEGPAVPEPVLGG